MKAETEVAPATVPRALAQFFIPVTASLQERRPRTMKHADTFAVFDHNGDALAGPGSPEGIYHRDTRYLSHLYLTVDGHRPLLLSSTIRDDNAVLICDLTNPEITGPEGEQLIAQDLVHIHRTPIPLERPRLRAAGDQQLRHPAAEPQPHHRVRRRLRRHLRGAWH